jgi:hypothetical protein
MSKNQNDLESKDIVSQYPDYSISGNSQGKHEANHYISITLVKDMLKDPKYAPRLAKLALDYQLDLTKPSDFTFSGERLPLVIDRLFFDTIEGIESDQYNTRWIKMNFSKFPFRKEVPLDKEKFEEIIATDLAVNIVLANNEEQKRELCESFYAQFVEPNLYQILLDNPKLTIKVINSIRGYKTSLKTGLLPSYLTQEESNRLYSINQDIITDKSDTNTLIRSAFEIIDKLLMNGNRHVIADIFRMNYLYNQVEGFSYLEDTHNGANQDRTRLFESNLESKIGITYDQYRASILELGQLVWDFYSEDLDPADKRIQGNSTLYILHDKSPRLETDYNLFLNSDSGFGEFISIKSFDINRCIAKSEDPDETLQLKNEYKSIIEPKKARYKEVENLINEYKLNNPDYKNSQIYQELKKEYDELSDFLYSDSKIGKERVLEIFDLLKIHYSVQEM